MAGSGAEQRRFKRYAARIRVLYRLAGATLAVEAETENLSVEGAFVRTEGRPLEVGTQVLLLLKLQENVMISGVVVWTTAEPSARAQGEQSESRSESRGGGVPAAPIEETAHPRGMGIRFTSVGDAARRALSDLLADLARSEIATTSSS